LKGEIMHPIEALCEEYNVTRYRLAKTAGLRESTLASLIARNNAVDKISVATIYKIAKALDMEMDLLYSKLKKYEENKKNPNPIKD
jgi:transcriptional regulator with XRE-family HTH domain